MNRSSKPVVVPNVRSLGGLLWSGVFVLLFFSALAVYLAVDRFLAAREALDSPRETKVVTPYFETSVPAGWGEYSATNGLVVMRRTTKGTLPFVLVLAERNGTYRYRALDANPGLLTQKIQPLLEQEFAVRPGDDRSIRLSGTEVVRAMPGISSLRAYFTYGPCAGLSHSFFIDNVRYVFVGCWKRGNVEDEAAVRSRVYRVLGATTFSETHDRFTRPVVNSADLTAAEHARIVRLVEREKVLWRLFADRVATEPETALMPAIEHFRKALRLLSSVREERTLLESPDVARYRDFLARRQASVRDWFVLLDKYRATGDRSAAKEQAALIVRRATLEEEALDRRRATQTLAEIDAELAAEQAAAAKEE